MKINILSLLVLLLLAKFNIATGQAVTQPQSKANNNAEFIFERVSIIDPGKIETDLYTLITKVRDNISNQVSDKNVVIFNAVPDTWEGKMKDVKNKANWPSIQKYTAWRIAASPEYDVLQIKAAENTSMPEGFVPTEDFYIVIKKSGVAKFNAPEAGKGFEMNCLLVSQMFEANETKFAGIKGKVLPSSGITPIYEANLPKAGAEKIYIDDNFGFNTLIAEFGTYTSLSKAIEDFSILTNNFKSCSSYDVNKVKDKENAYEIAPKGTFTLYKIDLKIEKDKDKYIIMLSLFHFI